MTKLELLVAYCKLNASEALNNLLATYCIDFNLKPLVEHIKAFYKGYARECTLINLYNIHEEETVFKECEEFISCGAR